ncbi:MAG: UvrB/UvrC motif-containing protein [Patescibacteria group bacterium]
MIWANFLHFYQPPTQKKYWVDRITAESYSRILKELEAHPDARLTINIAAVLLELWDKYGYQDVINGYRKLVERGQIEVTGSAKFHPLLPKLPDSEIIRQIKLNEATLFNYLGVVGPLWRQGIRNKELGIREGVSNPNSKFELPNSLSTQGFFPPEMAFDSRVGKLVADLGYRYVICDEYSFSGRLGDLKSDRVYEVGESGNQVIGESYNQSYDNPIIQSPDYPLLLFFRERASSFRILSGQLGTAKLFLDYLGRHRKEGEYLLTAMDGETFGHHRPGMDKLLFELYSIPEIKTVTLSELAVDFQQRETVSVRSATWALMEKDLEKNAPFSRWDDPDNEIHALQWELTNLAIETVNESRFKSKTVIQTSLSSSLRGGNRRSNLAVIAAASGLAMTDNKTDGDNNSTDQWLKARTLLDRALHSDQYWWASARPWWSLEMVEAGAKDLQDVILTVPDAPKQAVVDAKRLYFSIITTGFAWQRTNRVEAMSLKEDEEIRERTDKGLPKLPAEEIKKMIKTIEDEMLSVAEKREYERAAQLRDRIKELEAYLKE